MSSIKLKITQDPIEYRIQIGNGIIKEALSDISDIANYDKALVIYDSMIPIKLINTLQESLLNNNYQTKDFFKSNIAMKSEIKGLRIGTPKFGHWFFTPGFFSYGNTYRNYMGDNQSNNYGYWLNSYYLVPQRAITLMLNYNQSQKMVSDTITVFSDSLYLKEIFDPTTNIYAGVYIEFVNGFKGKITFNKKDEKWQGQLYKHYDFFSELSVENSLAKLLAQFKIKDLGEIWEKHIVGIELSVNLTEKWRFFTRGMIIDDRVGSRHSMFTELQYRTSNNTEL